jgi:FkbM family methyltransferase
MRGPVLHEWRDVVSRAGARLHPERTRLQQRIDKLERHVAKLEREATRARPVQTVALDYPGASLRLVAEGKAAAMRRHAARKEPFTVAWIESLPAGAVLYDIGANAGAYALIAAARPQGALRVVAFEPGFATFALLCRNVVLNGAAERVTPLPVTLGDRTGLQTFAYRDLAAGVASHGGITGAGDGVYRQPVLVHALDELVERFGLPAPEHIKLDVDGAEAAVLAGARGLLRRPALKSVLVELGGDGEAAIDRLLGEAGLRPDDTFHTKTTRPVRYGLYVRPDVA